MNKKTYTSKSVAVVMVSLGNGLSAQISFEPLIDGGSIFVTTDVSLQTALENHPMYGKLFSLKSTVVVIQAETAPKPKYYKEIDGGGGTGGATYKVVDVNDDIVANEHPPVCEELGVIYDNKGNETFAVTILASEYRTPDGNDIVVGVPVGGYAEASFLNINGTVYARGS